MNPGKAAEVFLETGEFPKEVERLDFKEYRKWMKEFGIALTRLKAMKSASRERFLIEAVSAIEDMSKIINIQVQRLREWFGHHYPEFKEEKHQKFVKAVLEHGRRENFPGFEWSSGVPMAEEDEKAIREFADLVSHGMKVQERLERYVERLMDEIAPNVSSVLGPLLGAKVISLFGSLEKMAKSPASAIQLIGAEKALFRHLKSGKKAKPPKYGIIYRHPKIQSCPPEKRGKAARIIASAASKAAKVDFFSGKPNPEIREKMEKALEGL